MTKKSDLPNSQELMWPTILALRSLGGSGRIEEINEEVIRQQEFTEEQLAVRRSNDERLSVIEYRLAWSRNNLKNAGAIENSARGVWALTDSGRTWSESELADHWQTWRTEYHRSEERRVGKER